MKDKDDILKRIVAEKTNAYDLMELHFKEEGSDDNGGFIRMYGKVQERINVLEWVLGEMEEKENK